MRLLALALAMCVGGAQPSEYSKYFIPCDVSAPNMTECLRSSVEAAVCRLAGGAPELDVEPLDPLLRERVTLDYNRNQVVVKIFLYNLTTTGLKYTKIKAVNFSRSGESVRVGVNATVDRIRVSGDFSIEGLYNNLQLNYKGRFNNSVCGTNITWEMRGTVDRAASRLRIQQLLTDVDLARLRVHFSDFKPPNRDIVQMANSVGNQNWRQFYRELKPHLIGHLNSLVASIADKVFLSVPYSDLFIDNATVESTSVKATTSLDSVESISSSTSAELIGSTSIKSTTTDSSITSTTSTASIESNASTFVKPTTVDSTVETSAPSFSFKSTSSTSVKSTTMNSGVTSTVSSFSVETTALTSEKSTAVNSDVKSPTSSTFVKQVNSTSVKSTAVDPASVV